MQRTKQLLLLALLGSVPFLPAAQTPADCSYNPDFDGDGAIGVVDLLGFLSFFGDTNSEGDCNFGPDVDCDGICDAFDDCVGEVDECGVCGGDGPDLAVIDTIIPIMDSVYIEALNGYHVFQAWADTSYTYTCSTAGCIDPTSYTFNPEAQVDDGSCLYSTPGCADGMESVTFDGYTYDLITIGDQCWFAENLRTTIYANGDSIIDDLTPFEWSIADYGETSASAIYSDPVDSAEVDSLVNLFGRLYNAFAASDGRSVCPSGWKVPRDADWIELEMSLGLPEAELYQDGWRGTTQDNVLKADNSQYAEWNGLNTSGLNLIPSGQRRPTNSIFSRAGIESWLWALPDSAGADFERRVLAINQSGINRRHDPLTFGLAIRCLKNHGESCFDPDEDGVCPEDEVIGCTEPTADNFSPEATEDDASCVWEVTPGCSDGLNHLEFDGYQYELIQIGDQCWFAENLRTTQYANGDSIPHVEDDAEWSDATTPASCIFLNNEFDDPYNFGPFPSYLERFGRIYNWYAAVDERSICPTGWHLPSHAEQAALMNHLASLGMIDEGEALKTNSFNSVPWNGQNRVGFNALPGGWRGSDGNFGGSGAIPYPESSHWWTSTELSETNARAFGMSWQVSWVYNPNASKQQGKYIRCVRD